MPAPRPLSLMRPTAKATQALPPTRVVVIDDDQRVLEGLEQRLRRAGVDWNLSFYSSSVEALAALHEEPGAIVVTDWMMPGLSGMALCEQVKAWGDRDEAAHYVIMMTGRQDVDSVVSALERGADDYLSKPFDLRELIARVRAGARVHRLEQELRAANEQLRLHAHTDALTGLPNRRQADIALARELDRTERGLQSLGILLADIDYFKKINDRFGHNSGDEVLIAIAEQFRRSARSYDTVARWGGEEFVVVCPGVQQDELTTVGERLRRAVASHPIRVMGDVVPVTVSIGCAYAARGLRVGSSSLIAAADERLYLAKHSGRNRVR